MNEQQKRAAFDLLESARRMKKAERDNRAERLRHHCGWLVEASMPHDRTNIDLFATNSAAEAACRALRQAGASGVQCIEASFTVHEYDEVMGDDE